MRASAGTSLIVAASLALAAAGCASASPPPGVVADDRIAVLVYNIHAGKDAAGVPSLDRIAAVIRDARADVVLLQEVDSATTRSGGVDQLAELARATGMAGVFGRSLDYQGGGYGIGILSRWPITRDSTLRLPVEPELPRAAGRYEPRSGLHAVIASPFGEVELLNTHLDAGRPDTFRIQESRTLLAFADARRRVGARLFLGGDLNSTPESVPQQMVRATGLVDAWTSCASGDGFTYPDRAPVKRIDYLYLPPGERCFGARVIESRASDHRPLLVEIPGRP